MNNGEEIDEETGKELEETYSRAKLLRILGRQGTEAALLKEAGYDIELENPVSYLSTNLPGRRIFRYVQTHPELDHMRGLAALVDSGVAIDNFWDTANDRPDPPSYRNSSDKEDWALYKKMRSGGVSGVTVLRLVRGAQSIYYNEDPKGTPGGDRIWILAPTEELCAKANETGKLNLHSYVLMLTHAGRSIILGGDADSEIWDSIVSAYGDKIKCDILKASHHGRDSGFHADALKLMQPTTVVVSVGKKPDTDASNKYRAQCKQVWSTRWLGTMTVTISDDGSVRWTAQHPERA